MELIAQIALGVIIGGLTIALVVIGFVVWNSRQKNERLAVRFLLLWLLVTSFTCPSLAPLPPHQSSLSRYRTRHCKAQVVKRNWRE